MNGVRPAKYRRFECYSSIVRIFEFLCDFEEPRVALSQFVKSFCALWVDSFGCMLCCMRGALCSMLMLSYVKWTVDQCIRIVQKIR